MTDVRLGHKRTYAAQKAMSALPFAQGFPGEMQTRLGDLFSLPSPAEQTECAEAGGKEWESRGKGHRSVTFTVSLKLKVSVRKSLMVMSNHWACI
jgi:hypothetical protein